MAMEVEEEDVRGAGPMMGVEGTASVGTAGVHTVAGAQVDGGGGGGGAAEDDGEENKEEDGLDAGGWRLVTRRRGRLNRVRAAAADARDRCSVLVWGLQQETSVAAFQLMCRELNLHTLLEGASFAWRGDHSSSTRRFEITFASAHKRDALLLFLRAGVGADKARRLDKHVGWHATASRPLRQRLDERAARTGAGAVAMDEAEPAMEPPAASPLPLANPFEQLSADEPMAAGRAGDSDGIQSSAPPAARAGEGISPVAELVARRVAALARAPRALAVKLACWNAQGLSSTKHYELGAVAEDLKIDVLAVTESHERGARADGGHTSKIKVRGYTWIGRSRPDEHGGVGFLVCAALAAVTVREPDSGDDQLWLRLPGGAGQRDLCLGVAYLPQEGAPRASVESAFERLEEAVVRFRQQGARVLLMGDFNARVGLPADAAEEEFVGKHGEPVARSANGRLLVDFLRRTGLACASGRARFSAIQYTRVLPQLAQRSVIDYVLVDQELLPLATDQGVYPRALDSDHRMLRVSLQLDLARPPRSTRVHASWRTDRLREDPETQRRFREAVARRFHGWWASVQRTAQGRRPSQDQVDEVYADLMGRIHAAGVEAVGKKRIVKGVTAPWWHADLRRLLTRKQAAHAKWMQLDAVAQRTGLPADVASSGVAQQRYMRLRAEMNVEVCRRQRESWDEQMDKLAAAHGTDSKKAFYSLLQRLHGGARSSSRVSGPVLDEQGRLLVQPADKRERLARFYEELGRDRPDAARFDETFKTNVERECRRRELRSHTVQRAPLDKDWTTEQMARALGGLKNGKACGPALSEQVADAPNEFLKHGGPALHAALLRFFNWVRAAELCPSHWSQGLVCTLYKDGRPEDPSNYRGITLLSCMGKLYTKLMQQHVQGALELKGRLPEEQGGFRAKRGCVDHVYTLFELLASRRREGRDTYVFFLDVRKAFDTTWRAGLWKQLWEHGVTGRTWRQIRALYAQVSARVLVDGEPSREFELRRGVRQGCALSTLLFIIFINGLVQELRAAGVGVRLGDALLASLLFADDVALVADSEEELQTAIDVVAAHSRRYRYRENLGKCGVMRVRGVGQDDSGESTPPACRFLGQPVPVVAHYKYLGVLLDDQCSWRPHVDRLRTGAARAVAGWRHVLCNRRVPVRARLELWERVLRPRLEYGTEVWWANKKEAVGLEAVQMSALRSILGCNARTSNEAVRADLGVEPLDVRRAATKLRWLRCLRKLAPGRLAATVFRSNREQKTVSGVQRSTWRQHTRACRLELGLKKPTAAKVKAACAREVARRFRKACDGQDEDAQGGRRSGRLARADRAQPTTTRRSKLELLGRLKAAPRREPWLMGCGTPADRLRFRLRSGTCALNEDQSRRQEERSAMCPSCADGAAAAAVETVEHFLRDCPAHSAARATLLQEVRATKWGRLHRSGLRAAAGRADRLMQLVLGAWQREPVISAKVKAACDRFLVDAYARRCREQQSRDEEAAAVASAEAKAAEPVAREPRVRMRTLESYWAGSGAAAGARGAAVGAGAGRERGGAAVATAELMGAPATAAAAADSVSVSPRSLMVGSVAVAVSGVRRHASTRPALQSAGTRVSTTVRRIRDIRSFMDLSLGAGTGVEGLKPMAR
jgi:exonuclease III